MNPHKSSHTATAVDPATGPSVASITVPASTAGYRRLRRWVRDATDLADLLRLGRLPEAWIA